MTVQFHDKLFNAHPLQGRRGTVMKKLNSGNYLILFPASGMWVIHVSSLRFLGLS